VRVHAFGNAGKRQHALSDTRIPLLGSKFTQGDRISVQLPWARLALSNSAFADTISSPWR
jgi:hypothetical protein